MKILDSLLSFSPYPVKEEYVQSVLSELGLDGEGQVTEHIFQDSRYIRAQSNICRYMAQAPNISQGGQTYSFSEGQREHLLKLAESLERQARLKDGKITSIKYGYKGGLL